jgi:hypothetical protein
MIVGYFGFRNILAAKIPATSTPMDTTSISVSIGVLIIAPTQPATGRISTGSPYVRLSKRARNLLQAAADLRE